MDFPQGIGDYSQSSGQRAALADKLPLMTALVSLEGYFLFVNIAYAKWLNVPRDEVIGKRIDAVFPFGEDEYRRRVLRNRRVVEYGIDLEFESIVPHPLTGEPRTLVHRVSPHESGLGVYVFVTDVTEQRRSLISEANLERELQKRGRALDQIFNLTDDILGILNFEGMFIEVSPSAQAITGLPSGYAKERNLPYHHFAIEEDRAALIAVFERATGGESIHGVEFRIRHLDGTIRWTSWNFRPVVEDRVILMVGRDVTPEKIREEALRQSHKMEALGQLTGGIAHDFNNLLMGIMGSLDVIDRRLPDEVRVDIARYIEGAQSSAKRAAALTHRLLAFSRRQPLAPVRVDINRLVMGMKGLIQRTIGTEIEVIDQLVPEIWPTLCDPNQLEAALLNLILNSRDAMEGKAGTILVKTLNIAPKQCAARGIPVGEYVKIVVQDNGCGMDDSTKQRAFDPFFTTKPIGKGTGLGLSMLYGFVHQSDGHVRIASSLGQGATIMIYLPRTTIKAVAALEEKVVVRSTNGEGRRVLLVEDEGIVRTLITDVLQNVGYTVVAHEEGNSALESLATASYDLLVTDVGLPGLSGMQVSEMARKMQPDLKVLFITGYARGITLRDDLLTNGDDMLLKPFTMEKLLAKVSDLINMREVA